MPTNTFIKFLFRSFAPFCAGGGVMANLSRLIETNPNYDAQWWKVAIFTIFGILFPHLIDEGKK